MTAGTPDEVYKLTFPKKEGTFALTSDVSTLSNDLSAEISAISSFLSTMISNDVSSLSTALSTDINTLSTKLSIEISSVVAVYDKDNNYIGNQLSTVKISNAEYANLVAVDRLNDKCIYVI